MLGQQLCAASLENCPHREHEAISARIYVLTVTGFALWTVFGVLRVEWPIIITNAICFCLSAIILSKKQGAKRNAQ